MEGQIKSFPDNKKLTEFITTKPVLYEMFKGQEEEGGEGEKGSGKGRGRGRRRRR